MPFQQSAQRGRRGPLESQAPSVRVLVLVDYNSNVIVEPASGTKRYSVGAAWLKLGADHRIVTPVARTGPVRSVGLDGDLALVAEGDMSARASSPRVSSPRASSPWPTGAARDGCGQLLRQTGRMGSHWRYSVAVLACTGLLLAGCGDSAGDDPVPPGESPASSTIDSPEESTLPPPRQEDAVALIEQALAARSANRLTEFAALVSAAGTACPDPGASRRLGQLGIIADRWSSAVAVGRPKVQATTEAQLAEADWDGLAAACARTPPS